MIEMLYKINKYSSKNRFHQECVVMECLVCNDREHFKEIIRETYGENIKFKYTKNLQEGDLYCTIIGELAYDKENFFNKKEFICSYCGVKVTTFRGLIHSLGEGSIKWRLFGSKEDYSKHLFCSPMCRENFIEKERKRIDPDIENDFYISKEDFKNDSISGYIYKITKKNSKEFYIGKTVHAPIWRWGQHLLTDRFPIENLENYQFEVLEVVSKSESLSEREKYWINKCYQENPSLCLNVVIYKVENPNKDVSISSN